MNFIETPYKRFDPYVQTEETIFNNIQKDEDFKKFDYNLVLFPTTFVINNYGIKDAYYILKNIVEQKTRQRKIFISQHIWTYRLDFKNGIVFTPHSTHTLPFITIPHYTLTMDKSKIREEKDLLFSFFGAVNYQSRRKIIDLYENCDDHKMGWGIDPGIEGGTKSRNTEKYLDLMCRSNFSLCPRGTGVSTIRLFESMAMESIPVIISDGFKPPLNEDINWNEFSITVKEGEVHKIKDILKQYSSDDINNMRKKLIEIYNEYFSNENLHKTIKIELEKL